MPREKHGLTNSKEYKVWKNMRYRCKNPNHTSFPRYGGRGIKVCQRWDNSFKAFFGDMGHKPTSKHSIERIDNNGNYEPNNCCWATSFEQMQNTRTNKNITFNGETLSSSEWCRRLGGNINLINARLKRSWSIHKILSTPANKKFARK